jgi:hypothetical protein
LIDFPFREITRKLSGKHIFLIDLNDIDVYLCCRFKNRARLLLGKFEENGRMENVYNFILHVGLLGLRGWSKLGAF